MPRKFGVREAGLRAREDADPRMYAARHSTAGRCEEATVVAEDTRFALNGVGSEGPKTVGVAEQPAGIC